MKRRELVIVSLSVVAAVFGALSVIVDGDSVDLYSQAMIDTSTANSLYSEGLQAAIRDQDLLVEVAIAEASGDIERAEFLKSFMTLEALQSANWTTSEFSDEYYDAIFGYADTSWDTALQNMEKARQTNNISDILIILSSLSAVMIVAYTTITDSRKTEAVSEATDGKRCGNCRAELAPGARFCRKCGAKVLS